MGPGVLWAIDAAYGMSSVNWPGTVTWITPPHMHINWQVLSSEGLLPVSTVGAPGTQGDTVIGMQGCGVSTPSAAAVAAATIGLAGLMHMPKGTMLTIGWWSMIVPAGWLLVSTRSTGRTTSCPGAIPKLHIRVAPLQTCCGMEIGHAG